MKSTNPLVTIICSCYNHEEFVIHSLNSISEQAYTNIELLIVDDCSSDNSVAVIANWILENPSVTFIKNETNLGITKSFNQALKLATGDYVIDLAADDLLAKDCIKLQLAGFQNSKFSNLGIVYGNAKLIDVNGAFDSYFFETDSNLKILQKRPTGNIYASIIDTGKSYCSITAMTKKSVFDQLNGYDENLDYEDFDFWVRVSRDFDIDYIDEILVQKRIVKNSLGTNFDKYKNKINHSTFLILKKAYLLNKTKAEHKFLLKRVHYEMINAFKNSDYLLLLNYIPLELKLRFSN